MASESDHRLPRTVIPRRYRLHLEPDLVTASFTGWEDVDIDVVAPTSCVVVNSVDLDIADVRVADAGGEIAVAGITSDLATERVSVDLARPLEPGPATFHAAFTGVLNDRLRGFYLSSYDHDGEKRFIASTQFESTDARRAFPCWDEPDLKATFAVTMAVPAGLTAVSNGPVIADEPVDHDKRLVTFEETMVMSTYLVAFVVGDLEATEAVDVDGVPLRVLHVPGKAHLARFALEAGAFALRFFSDYYGIPYPGTKVDMIGIPDFAWGAMENLGAITFRETALLVDPEHATRAELTRVADVIAHELAHMWFGDLVTMKWWNGIWLNEAFATFMELKCVDSFRPEWTRWLSFAEARANVMDIDSLATTRPIEYPVGSPDEAAEMFDSLTYVKGAAVLRMLEQYIGEDVFRSGISLYLTRHANGNTETADLWNALEEVSAEPVAEIMGSWIFQGGHPRLSVTRTEEGADVAQAHFRYLEGGDARWRIPMLFGHGSSGHRVIVDDPTSLPPGDRLIVNRGGHGFYRVQYSPELLGSLAERIMDLEPLERHGIVADTWANVLTGAVPASEFVALTARLRTETEPVIWSAALSGLDELDRIASSDVRPALRRFVGDLVSDHVDRLGWQPLPGEDDRAGRLRGLLLRAAGVLGEDRAVGVEAELLLMRAVEDRDAVDADVAAAALAIVASRGGMDDYRRFVALYESADTPQEAVRFLNAAISVPEASAVEDAFAMLLGGRIRRQDSFWVVARLLGSREAGGTAWELAKANWQKMLDSMPSQNTRRAFDLLHLRSEPTLAADIETWMSGHPVPAAERTIDQQLERLRVRVGLRERESDRLGDAF